MTIPKSADINGRTFIDDAGRELTFVKAGTTLTAKTIYRLQFDESGVEAVALADDQLYYRLCIPEAGIASGASGWVVTRGLVEDATIPSTSATAGYAFKVYDGAVTSMGAAWAFADEEHGVYCETISSATTCNVFLSGREGKGTT
jgi:hypothetical protein